MLDQITVIKRDGREVPFDRCRISDAILKAAKDFEEFSPADAVELTDHICDKLYHKGHPSFAVEEIQDEVVDILTSAFPKIATAYQLYRQKRTDIRDMKSVSNKVIADIVLTDAKDNNDKRENANIDGDSTMGAMLKIGGTIAKEFNLRNLFKPKHARLHREGVIHIHDGDFAALTFNCLQIPLGKLLDRGFNTGHGSLRTPATIGAAATLMCIIIQSSQNDAFGGQAIPTTDYDLAPYVARSYVRNVALYLETHGYADYNLLKQQFVKPLDEFIDTHRRIINDAGYVAIKSTLYQILPQLDLLKEESELFDFVLKKTERDTYQAMEATIHNLCTLQSRCGAQPPFSSLNFGTDTSEEGRMVSRNLMLALDAGLGAGETAIFPISIFKMKKGINRAKGEPNYDLFKLACKVSAKRLFPKQHWGNYVVTAA